MSVSPFINDMFAYATPGILGFGSGGDGFALRLDEALEFFSSSVRCLFGLDKYLRFGASRPCATYGNTSSLLGGREHFPVQCVQVWTFGTQF